MSGAARRTHGLEELDGEGGEEGEDLVVVVVRQRLDDHVADALVHHELPDVLGAGVDDPLEGAHAVGDDLARAGVAAHAHDGAAHHVAVDHALQRLR